MEETKRDYSHIQGWGADLDEKNRPAYPKERIPARDIGVHWKQPEQQEQHVKILHSKERPDITPLFGSPNPPSGFSGKIREGAFGYSENDIRHWLLLLFADRANMIEGVVSDLAKGHIPNIFAEMGLKSELKYNRSAFIKKTLTVSAIAAIGLCLLTKRKKTKRLKSCC